MRLQVERADFAEIEASRDRLRSEAGCQIVRDSILQRELADAYLLLVDGKPQGHGGVWTEHFPGRVMEFFVERERRELASDLFVALVEVGGATHVEAQTNMELQYRMLLEHSADILPENILFGDGPDTGVVYPGVTFRARTPSDSGPAGEWVVERGDSVVAGGGFLRHYNPPYADLFMEVVETEREKGIGSYLVQELRRACREAGSVPAARCGPANRASRRALERGGMVAVGTLVAGQLTVR